MRLVLVHAAAMTIELGRYPAYVVPTLLFPSVFFLLFAVPGSDRYATPEMAAFAGFGAIGVAFFQFGVGIATERSSPWESFVRALPISVAARLASRLISAAAFALAAAGLVVATALLTTDAHLPRTRWLELAFVLLAGTIPCALLGTALGYWVPPRGALPIANLLYLGLSYAGGLWFRPEDLPGPVAAISPLLPTRALADALWDVSTDSGGAAARTWFALLAFSVAFALLAAWGYRRDEGRRFR
jgi:ABC-2 type transport system permease protein